MLWMFIYFSICYLCSLEKANVVFLWDNIAAVIYVLCQDYLSRRENRWFLHTEKGMYYILSFRMIPTALSNKRILKEFIANWTILSQRHKIKWKLYDNFRVCILLVLLVLPFLILFSFSHVIRQKSRNWHFLQFY